MKIQIVDINGKIVEILSNFSNDIQKSVNLTIQAPKSDIFNLKLKLNQIQNEYNDLNHVHDERYEDLV